MPVLVRFELCHQGVSKGTGLTVASKGAAAGATRQRSGGYGAPNRARGGASGRGAHPGSCEEDGEVGERRKAAQSGETSHGGWRHIGGEGVGFSGSRAQLIGVNDVDDLLGSS